MLTNIHIDIIRNFFISIAMFSNRTQFLQKIDFKSVSGSFASHSGRLRIALIRSTGLLPRKGGKKQET